jgi:predicted transcriptional regulator
MSTTTLRIDAPLRDRITRLAHALNQTPHSFMVEALAQKADEAEWRLGLQQEAQARDLALQAGEPEVEWHEMKTYLRARLADAAAPTEPQPTPASARS